ncbi:MAG: amidophosphoribosyltransferase [Bacteroidales bacterium]|nr:amidophosphoribosyltransferase [Bacteroidales bacterium]MDD4823447.1 amidophosphoribosyltransferase [Bacteroidales bacterium]
MGGFFGTISKTDCTMDLYYGTDYNSHLGTSRGGLAMLSDNGFVRSIHNLENSYFRSKFESELKHFSGNSGIGVISDTDSQPIIVNSHLGRFAIVTVAKVNNLKELEAELLEKNRHFSEFSSGITNQTELLAMLITEGKDFVDGINNLYNKVKGSCTMLLLTEKGIIIARDKFGRLPIVIGKKEGAYAVSGETSSFPNLDFEPDYYVGPGEILLLTAEGYQQLQAPGKRMQICSFMWVYYGYPPSMYEGVNVDAFRYENGLLMASTDDVKADFVAGIPDSGIGCALGYAEGLNLPYRRAIVKYTPTWPRSFTPSDQKMRQLVAKMKLIPNRSVLQGKKVVFCDDSIVRGTQLRDNVNILYGYGAKEVHMRISCPPLVFACPFINFSASKSEMELITRRAIKELEGDSNVNTKEYITHGSPCYCKMVERLREKFGLSSLKFNSLENMIKAVGLPKESVCTHCFDGSSYLE